MAHLRRMRLFRIRQWTCVVGQSKRLKIRRMTDGSTDRKRQKFKRALLGTLVVLLLFVIGQQFLVAYPGAGHHPYVFPFFLFVLGAFLLYAAEAYPWKPGEGWVAFHKGVVAIAEAFLVVAVVVVLFEIPHFTGFYEDALRRILTTRAYVEKLSPDERRDIVQSVVGAHLGLVTDSNLAAAYTRDIYRAIDEGQYVVDENRYFEKSWAGPARDAMKSENRMTRTVRVINQRVVHQLNDYVSGEYKYWIVVDHTLCLELANTPGRPNVAPLRSQAPALRKACNSRVTNQARGHLIKVDIPLERGSHMIQRVIRRFNENPTGTVQNTFGLDYFTQSISLKYHYPPDFALEVFGHGDLEAPLAKPATATPVQEDQNEFEQSVPDGWFARGANVSFILFKTDDSNAAVPTRVRQRR